MKRLCAILSAGALLVVTAIPASAASVGPTTDPSAATPHCVGAARPMGSPSSGPPKMACYPTFAQALADATDGAVTVSLSATPADFTQEMATASSSTTIIGIDWEDPDYQCCFSGWVKYWEVPNDTGCAGGYNWVVDSMGSLDNEVSSAQAYSGCSRYDHWEHNYGEGARAPFH